jgi:hypothetical protein
MRKFCLQKGDMTREKLAIYSCNRFKFSVAEVCPDDQIPIGDLDFCANAMKWINVDFYPKFLAKYMQQSGTIFQTNSDYKVQSRMFYKDITKWKSDFKSRVYEVGEVIPPGIYWEFFPLTIVQEWRYYTAKGLVYSTGWYDGENDDEEAPCLGDIWPKDFCGAVDFGRLDDGSMTLIEAHAPFACGWYGDNHKDYAFWQYDAYEQLMGKD